MDIKTVLGAGSIVLALVGYFPYVRNVVKGKTKPHALSWLVWAVLSAIAFAIQVVNNGGAGAWLTGLAALASIGIFFISLKKGETNILFVDWLSLLIATVALALWFITDRPLLAVILISSVDAIGGFFPTFRKSFSKPYEETASLYFIYAASLMLSLAALRNFDLVNALYPGSFVLINLSMVVFLGVRRLQLSSSSISND
ncbi:MAG: hypothetical protein AAB971_01445 [Patescibacteria group bacterium]